MAVPAAGAVVLVRFPFSDLTRVILRPAVVLAAVGRGDTILCQVTSKRFTDPRAIELRRQDFLHGGLRKTSYARPGKLFTANRSLVVREVGQLGAATFDRLIEQVISLLRGGSSTPETSEA